MSTRLSIPAESLSLLCWKRHSLILAFLLVLGSASSGAQTFAPVSPLGFAKPFAGANPLPQTLTINSVGAAFAFSSAASTSTGGNWLSVSVGPGCTGGGSCSTPHAITVAVNAEITLAAGTYNGQVVVTSSNAVASMTIPVTLTIAAAGTAFFDNLQGQASFFMETAGTAPPGQPIQVRNGGSGSLPWTLSVSTSDGGNWLSASATSGTAPSVLTISVSKQNLPGGGNSAGTFIGRLLFQSAGGNVSVPVSFVVGDSVVTQLNPIHVTKLFAGANPLPVTLAIASTGSLFAFISGESTGTGGDWMSISVGLGCTGGGACNTPHAITASFNPIITLPAGTYTGQVVVTPVTGSFAMTVPVYLTVVPPSTPFFDNVPGQMSFSMKTSGAAPPSQIIDLRNGDTSGTLNWTLVATTSDGGNWLNVSATSGTTPSSVTVGITPANLPGAALVAGTFTGQLLFQSASSRVAVPISVTVGADVFNQVNGIAFTKLFAGPDPLDQTIVIGSTGQSIAFSTAESTATGGDWLSVSLGSGCTGGGVCATPHVITASVNASPTLPVGTYTGQIVVTSNTGSIAMTIPVTLAVLPASAAYFDNVPGQLSFSMKTNGTGPPAQPVRIRNAGAGTLNWSLIASTADGGNWISASPANGTAPSVVSVSVLKQNIPGAGLLPGTFTGNLLFQSPGGASATVPVTFTVGNDVYDQVNPISFTKIQGGANPLPQVLTITSTGAEIVYATTESTSTGRDWLSVSIGTGCTGGGFCSTPHVIVATVNAAPTLAAGTYSGQIVIISSATAASMTIPVTLTVVPASTPVFDNVQGQLSFSAPTAGGNPPSQTVQIRNAGPGTLNWTVSAVTADGGNWLTTSATSGTAPSNVTVGVIVANLPGQGLIADRFGGMLTFTSATGTVTIPVSVVIGTPAFVQATPLAFSKAFGGANPLSQTLSVTSNGAAIAYSTAASSGNGGNWLGVNIGAGCTGGGFCSTPHNVTVSATPNQALAPGTYTAQIVFNGTTSAMTVPVTLTIAGQTPTSVAATGGTPQSTTVNTAFANRLVATVRDANNNPVSGVTVSFTVPASGASATFAGGVNTAVTDANGQATSGVLSANGIAGSYTATASAVGIATPAAFSLTNAPVVITCVTSVSPAGTTVGPGQTITTFNITTTPGCNWTASSNASWLEIFPLTGTGSGSIQWTAYPNFGTLQRTAVATVGDKTFTVTQTAGSEALLRRFIRLLYFSFLARAASDAEVTNWVNSGQTRAQLATSFLNSPEFNLGGRFTAGLYVGIIDRDAEFTGWQFQRQALARGIVNQDQLVSNFLNSAEFTLKFGVLSNADFVRLMYENVLLRPAAQAEVDAWLNVLSNPANTRTIIARSFLNSPEFQQGTGPRLLAFLLYATLLLRDGTAQQRAALEAQLASPAQLPVLIEQFVNSVEINALLQ